MERLGEITPSLSQCLGRLGAPLIAPSFDWLVLLKNDPKSEFEGGGFALFDMMEAGRSVLESGSRFILKWVCYAFPAVRLVHLD